MIGDLSNGFGDRTRAQVSLDSIAHPTWLLGTDGSVLDLNEAARLGGDLERSRVLGHPFWDVPWWPGRAVDMNLVREGFEAAVADGDARFRVEETPGDGGPAVDVTFSRIASGAGGEAGTVVAQAHPLGDPGAGGRSSRHTGLRRLAAGLAAAATVDEVSAAIADLTAPAVGACFSLVAYVESGRKAPHPAHLPGRPEGATPLSPKLTPAITTAVDTGISVVIDDPDVLAAVPAAPFGGADAVAPARITIHPMPAASDHPGVAVVLGWPTSSVTIAADDDAGDVLALCGAALLRARATRRAEELATVMEALIREAPIGIAYFDTELRFVHLNERLAAMSRKPIEDHLGRTIREIAPDLASTVESIMRHVVATGRPTDKLEIHGAAPGDPDEPAIWESAFIPVPDRDGNVIGVAAIVEDITERRRTREELERLYDREREVANRLQQGMLPSHLPVPDGYELATRYVAGTGGLRIGGDWYDLIELGPDRYGLVIGDVVGHGLDAALTMTTIHHALAGLCHAIAKPGPLLDRLDEFLTHDGDQLVATLFYGLLEPSTGRLTFSSAGHPPALLVTGAGATTTLTAGRGVPLGITGAPRHDAATMLAPGDTLLLYTDGIFERRGEPFNVGLERLVQAASRHFDDLNDLAGSILEEVPDARHSDDIALMALRRRSD